MTTTKAAGFRHVVPTKRFTIGAIQQYGAKFVLGDNFEGSDDEAIAAVQAQPGDLIQPEGCDNFDPVQGCLGHRRA